MVHIQRLGDKQSANSVRQEIFVHLLHKGSSHARMGHTVRMGHLCALSALVVTGELWFGLFTFDFSAAEIRLKSTEK